MRHLTAMVVAMALGGCASVEASPEPVEPEYPFRQFNLPNDARLAPMAENPTREIDETLAIARRQGEVRPVCIEGGSEPICAPLGLGDALDYQLDMNGATYFIRLIGDRPQADFPPEYENANRGRISVVSTPAYELVNVAIALTPTAQAHGGMVWSEGNYYAAVQAEFSPFRDHPFVQWLDGMLTESLSYYSNLKMNGHAFDFDAAGQLQRSAIYGGTGFPQTANILAPRLEEMRDFAAQTRFLEFYQAHAALYREQREYFERDVDSQRMLSWLSAQFPSAAPYDHVKILFSPLVYGWQSMTRLEDGEFRELQAHINFPYPDPSLDAFEPESRALVRGNLLFTEMNHGFSDPTAEPLQERIAVALGDGAGWAAANSSASAYGSPQALFNEMMNWALVSLYYIDHAPAADLDELIERLEREQDAGRGFRRFAEFNRELIRVYRARGPVSLISS